MTFAYLVAAGKEGRSSLYICVETTSLQPRILTDIGLDAGCKFMRGSVMEI